MFDRTAKQIKDLVDFGYAICKSNNSRRFASL